MGMRTRVGCGTADTVLNMMDSVTKGNNMLWKNCIALSMDNVSMNIGDRNSIKSRVLTGNPSVFILGCPCHIVHNASAAGTVYTAVNHLINPSHSQLSITQMM